MTDYKLPGTDIILDKGTAVCFPLLGLHYDPKYFPEPQKYDPERFSEANKRKYPFGAYMPFGEGPHNCIGKIILLPYSVENYLHFLTNRCKIWSDEQ